MTSSTSQTSPAVTGWHHLAYPVPDLERSGEWYARVLRGEITMRTGWSEMDRRAGRTRQVWVTAGTAVINLAEGPIVERPPGLHFFHFAMDAPAAELDAWIAHLTDSGVKVLGPYGHGGVGLLSLYFDDPDGYRLELMFDFGDYETAKTEAIARGGALGNPDLQYEWV
ncbi:VOC family protein [Pseudonocardia sp. ICBG1034]|uniref:VOC family protein n=1 Tax=Pseudonocardia sp. ICBG1034 TaxID=2844381 RepID=UPI001CC9AE32|nr:VOC family protein [Pseudonocardia sp. ICBG1034]